MKVGRSRPHVSSVHSFRTNIVLAICIGSNWPGPLNFPSSRDELHDFVEKWRSKFKEAKDILLVGAGAVGLGETSNILPTPLLTTIKNCPAS